MLHAAVSDAVSTNPIRNPLLAALAPHGLARLRPHLEPAAMSLGKVLTEPGRPIVHVLFPEADGVSVLAVASDKGCHVEAGVIGRGGVVGLPVVLGADAELHETLVQADMQGWRLQSDVLRRVMANSPALRGVLRCRNCGRPSRRRESTDGVQDPKASPWRAPRMGRGFSAMGRRGGHTRLPAPHRTRLPSLPAPGGRAP